ncbi:MAG: glycosyltransferase family 4 protein [Aquaticitalea sp.]
MKKLAIITTHPIQYNAPWFRLLAERGNCEVKVFYTWSQSKESVTDRTFGKEIKWDLPLLEGYQFEFVENVSKNPGSHHFFGIDCPSLISDITNYQPDAILFFGWKFKSHFKAMRHFKGKIPVWFRGDSTLLDEVADIKSKVRRLILKKVYNYVDKAFYVGKASKAYFLKHNLKENQLVYAPHAIDNNRFMDDESKQYGTIVRQWRKELGISDDDIVVLFAGKFESKKQPLFLIKAFIEANNDRKNSLKLIMVGNGPQESDIIDTIENAENIQLLPFQNQTQMPLVYRLCDVFCLPSKGPGETWGLAVNEAMACGKPVIVSNRVGCAEDLVKSGSNGYVFSYDSNTELVSCMTSLTFESLKKMGEQAERDIQNFNFLSIVQAIEQKFSTIRTSNHNPSIS